MNGVDTYLGRETAWAVTGFIPGIGLLAGFIFEAPVAAIAKRALKEIPDASQTKYFNEKLEKIKNKTTTTLKSDEIKKLNNFSYDMFFDETNFMEVEQNPGSTPFGYIRCLARNFISYMNREAQWDSLKKKFAEDKKLIETEVRKEEVAKIERDMEGHINYYKDQCTGYIDTLPLSPEIKTERKEMIDIFCIQLQASVMQLKNSTDLSKNDLNIALMHTYQSLKYNIRKNLYHQHIFKGLIIRPTLMVGQIIDSIYHAFNPIPRYKTLT